jgi:hypothetical protein
MAVLVVLFGQPQKSTYTNWSVFATGCFGFSSQARKFENGKGVINLSLVVADSSFDTDW